MPDACRCLMPAHLVSAAPAHPRRFAAAGHPPRCPPFQSALCTCAGSPLPVPAFSFLGSPMPDNPALPAPKNLDIPLLFFLQALF